LQQKVFCVQKGTTPRGFETGKAQATDIKLQSSPRSCLHWYFAALKPLLGKHISEFDNLLSFFEPDLKALGKGIPSILHHHSFLSTPKCARLTPTWTPKATIGELLCKEQLAIDLRAMTFASAALGWPVAK